MKKRIFLIATITVVIVSLFSISIYAADFERGDVNCDNAVDSKDAIYLLRNVLLRDKYPIFQNGDMNRDGRVTTNDAVYLLRHTMSKDEYAIDCEVLGHVYENSTCIYCVESIDEIAYVQQFASDSNYNYLATLSNAENMQAFYRALDSDLSAFHSDYTIKAEEYESESGVWYSAAITNYSDYGITVAQALQVWNAYRDDHPLYYWIYDYTYSDTVFYTTTTSNYVDGSARADYNERVYSAIENYIFEAEISGSDYETALIYFDEIINNCDRIVFSNKDYSQIYKECSIVGPLLYNKGMNSGYAKLFQLLMNYENIENWYAWNSNPLYFAWNLVKLDDGNWYWFDLAEADKNAWDVWDTYDYFCKISSDLPDDYVAFAVDNSPTAPTLSNKDFSIEGIVEIHSNFSVDNVMYKLLNSDREVMVVSHSYSTVDNIKATIKYRDVEYRVMDVVNNGSDWINMAAYESMVCYEYLATLPNGRKLQKLYEEFDAKLTMFHIGEIGDSHVVSLTDGGSCKVVGRINYKKYGLTVNDASMINRFYRIDHPLYYWHDNSWAYNTGTGIIWPCTVDEYDTYSERKEINPKVYNGIKRYISLANGETNAYSLALSFYDAIITSCEYANNSSGNPESALWAHSILGAFTNNSFVCEGYAKLFQLLMTYYKLDNMYVTGDTSGGGHAWNLIKLDDGKWYWCDATWGDGTGFFKYFCATDVVLLSTHTPDSNVNSSTPWDILPTLPSRATSLYSYGNTLRLKDTFVFDGHTYRLVGFNKVECISTVTPGEKLPKNVNYNGKSYNVVSHLIQDIYWNYNNNNGAYRAFCLACNDDVDMYEVEEETLELTFYDSIENEISQYEGFSVVSPSRFTRLLEPNGNYVLNCSSSLFIDVDRQTLADLGTFAITFDFKVKSNGNAGQEISVVSLLSNYQNGSKIQGTNVNWGWFLKYNTNAKKLETLQVSGNTSALNDKNSIDVSPDTVYRVKIIVDTVMRKSYVIVNGNTLGMTVRSPWCLPDLSLEEYDDALSIRFNDGGNCSMTYDNFRIVAIN